MKLTDAARDTWKRSLDSLDAKAIESYGLGVREMLGQQLGVPADHFNDPLGASSLLRTGTWAGSIAMRIADDDLWVLFEITEADGQATLRFFVLARDEGGGPPRVLAPPFVDLESLGRALEEPMEYPKWIEYGRPDDRLLEVRLG